jgi:hypothetical protein
MSSEQELDFDAWLTDMDDALDRFLELVPAELAAKLDYSPESLVALERWLLQRYPDLQSLKIDPELALVDGATRYVGETFVRNLGAHWTLNTNPKNVFYGLPVVTGHPRQTTPQCPHKLLSAATARREGAFLRKVFDSQNQQR